MKINLDPMKVRLNTLEQQADEMRAYAASLTPLERLHYLKWLIKMAYGKKAEEPANWISRIRPVKNLEVE